MTLKVGESIVLKGVRNADCDNTVPSWDHVRRGLPRSKLGVFSDGGAGTVQSKSCGNKRVGARGVRFKARKTGTEQLSIFSDGVRVTVK
ncbi:hypothetical protein D1F64_15270 [Breoghania sp. L-A4]|nr:hypothetical protein D1F64_15270 [Breoghania sp. L-A4]